MARRNLLGLTVRDRHGREVGRVVDTWPDDGGWEVELVVVRLLRSGERRMLPADGVVLLGAGAVTVYSWPQVQDAPAAAGGRHGGDDPDRARAYWMFQDTGMFSPRWRRSSGSSGTERPFPTIPSTTTSVS